LPLSDTNPETTKTMTYKATRNDGGQTETFEDFTEACEWVANGIDFEECENGPGSTYIFPEGAEDNNDCLGAVDEVED
jgi:hypothetical protein